MSYNIQINWKPSCARFFAVKSICHTEDRVAQHPGLEILYNVSMPFTNNLRGKRVTIHPGEAFIYYAREQHTEKLHQNSFSYSTVIILEDFINDLLEPFGVKFADLVFDSSFLQFNSLNSQILALTAQLGMTLHSELLTEVLVTSLLVDLLETQNNSYMSKFKKFASRDRFHGVKHRVKKAFLHNLYEKMSLDQLAKEVGVSKFHLVRIFKLQEQITPINYFSLLKIELAKEYLVNSNKSITDIAMSLGFEYVTTLNHLFRKAYGMSPRHYRQMMKQPAGD
ncbi:MAG: helix-turn-helix transcriptional regulator [Bdellovibrionales bacterium]|nr:helix-turn-helix transcriptional regulator [Bdellovibrionales bacterium]